MSRFRFELDRAGVRQLLKSQKMADVLKAVADEKSAGAAGVETGTFNAKTRRVAKITAITAAAIRDNEENNTLLRMIKNG